MKRTDLTEEYLINGWMQKYHGLTIAEAYEKEPWTDSHDFYKRYPVTQEQHDEWYAWALDIFAKTYKYKKSYVKTAFAFIYLNTSPSVL